MACCIVAALILAQCAATLRRWGMFWGLVTIPRGEDASSIFTRLRALLATQRVRALVLTVIVLEVTGLGLWVYFAHGAHLAEVADIGWSRLQGKDVVYTSVCGKNGQSRVRLVFERDSLSPH